jgi:endonuclease/exonuclease/phosphatase family metal-dependent hydrolase
MVTASKTCVILFVLCNIGSILREVHAAEILRIMSFNIWMSGVKVEDGIHKIAKHIKLVDPDIVALQEVDRPEILRNITKRLGGSWTAHFGSAIYSDVGILTKHKVS